MLNKFIIKAFIIIAAFTTSTAVEGSLSADLAQNMTVSSSLSKGKTEIIIPFKAKGLSTGNINVASSIIRDQLRNVLRKDMGATYSVNVRIKNQGQNSNDKVLIVKFSSNKEKQIPLLEAAFKTLRRLSVEGISQEQAKIYQTLHQQRLKKETQKNSYWLSVLSHGAKKNISFTKFGSLDKRYDQINAASLKQTFKQINPFSNYRIIASL
jgi:hypothetical protein